MESDDNRPMLRIDKDFISALPLMQYEGKIVLVERKRVPASAKVRATWFRSFSSAGKNARIFSASIIAAAFPCFFHFLKIRTF